MSPEEIALPGNLDGYLRAGVDAAVAKVAVRHARQYVVDQLCEGLDSVNVQKAAGEVAS